MSKLANVTIFSSLSPQPPSSSPPPSSSSQVKVIPKVIKSLQCSIKTVSKLANVSSSVNQLIVK